MRLWLVCLLICIAARAAAAQSASLDEFDEDQGPFVIVTSSSTPGDQFQDTVEGPGIIGAYRRINYSAYSDQPNLVFSMSVSAGELMVSAAVTSYTPSGGLWVTWDGGEGGKGNEGPHGVDPTGLGGLDFTAEGYNVFQASMKADFAKNATLTVFSTSLSNYCTLNFATPTSTGFVDVTLPFETFLNVGTGCDFNNVGAIQFYVPTLSNYELSMDFLRLAHDDAFGSPSGGDNGCQVSMYTGGAQCKLVDASACTSCSAGGAEDYYQFNCTTTASGCECYQYLYSNDQCSGTPLVTAVPAQSCVSLASTFPEGAVCYATAQVIHEYQVNFFNNDPGVTAGECRRTANETCVPCTAGGLTNYYSPQCDSSAAASENPCVLKIYASSDPSCSSDPVEVPMSELTCTQLSSKYSGDSVCAFAFEEEPYA